MTPLLPALPDDARVWLFAFDGPAADVLPSVRAWLPSWTSHGRPVTADVAVVHDAVLAVGAMISAAELNAGVSGCGVDAMHHAVEAAAASAGRAILPTLLINWQDSAGHWQCSGRPAFRRAIADGTAGPSTPVLDLTLSTVDTLRRIGVVRPAGEAWTKHLFGRAAV